MLCRDEPRGCRVPRGGEGVLDNEDRYIHLLARLLDPAREHGFGDGFLGLSLALTGAAPVSEDCVARMAPYLQFGRTTASQVVAHRNG